MNSKQLRYFCVVVESGSLTKAAVALGMTQPALSKAIKALEHESATPLLARSSAGVTPTSAGRRLFGHAKNVGLELEVATADLRRVSRSSRSTLSIGALPSLMSGIIAPAVAEWRGRYPDYPIAVSERSHAELMVALECGQIDIAIGRAEKEREGTGFTQRRLFRDRFVVVCRAGHPLASVRHIELDALGRFPWIFSSFARAEGPLLERLFRGTGSKPPPARTESSCMSFILSTLREGDSLAILARHTIAHEIDDGVLCALAFSSPLFERDIAAYHLTARPRSAEKDAAAAIFSKHVADVGQRATLPLLHRRAARR